MTSFSIQFCNTGRHHDEYCRAKCRQVECLHAERCGAVDAAVVVVVVVDVFASNNCCGLQTGSTNQCSGIFRASV